MEERDIIKDWVRERYIHRYSKSSIEPIGTILKSFEKNWSKYLNLKPFAPNGNVFDSQENIEFTNKVHFIMRLCTQYHLTEAFRAMRIDLDDDNVKEDLENGNIGTFGRIAKVWVGANTEDDRELGSGRWSKKPRIASFPNTNNSKIPITKRVDIISNCSHHFISFNSISRPDSYAVISYIPDEKVLGISKLQRMADWVSQRFFLQEDLTKMLYEEISKVAETKSVYVGLFNMVHGCESTRGAKSKDGAFTSEYYGGLFTDINLRDSVRR